MQGNHPKNKSQSPLQCHPASLTHAVLHPSPLCCSLACCFPFKLPRASQGPSCCVHTALYLLSLRTEGPATPQKTATLTIVFNAHSRLRIFFFQSTDYHKHFVVWPPPDEGNFLKGRNSLLTLQYPDPQSPRLAYNRNFLNPFSLPKTIWYLFS